MNLIKAQCVFRSQTIDRGPRQNNRTSQEETSRFKERKTNLINQDSSFFYLFLFGQRQGCGKGIAGKNDDLQAKV